MIATFIKSTTRLDELPRNDKPHVAFVGRSNVGKSSLINHLLQRKDLARVSTKAGRTATINLYDIDNKFYMVDLPGYGFTRTKTKRAGFAELFPNYLSNTPQVKLVLMIIDAFVGPVDLDVEMFEFLHERGIPFIIIVNKIDKLSNNQATALLESLTAAYPFATFIPHSILTNTHRGVIREAITSNLKKVRA